MTLTVLAFLIILITLPVSYAAVKLIGAGYELAERSGVRRVTHA